MYLTSVMLRRFDEGLVCFHVSTSCLRGAEPVSFRERDFRMTLVKETGFLGLTEVYLYDIYSGVVSQGPKS